MSDLSSSKIEITTGVNDVSKSPPYDQGINVGFLTEKFNSLIDRLQTQIDLLKARVAYSELDSYGTIRAALVGTLDYDETQDEYSTTFTVDSGVGLYISFILVSGISDSSAVSLSLNGTPFTLSSDNQFKEYTRFYIDGATSVSIGDTLTVTYSQSSSNPIEVIIYVF